MLGAKLLKSDKISPRTQALSAGPDPCPVPEPTVQPQRGRQTVLEDRLHQPGRLAGKYRGIYH